MPKKPTKHDKPARDDVYDAGGKVDADAIVAALQHAREEGLEGEDDEQMRRVRFELQHDLDKRLDKYLTDRISFLSRTQLQKLIDDGEVKVNSRPAKASTKLNKGDVVEVVVPAPPAKDIQPEDIPLEVMYEDDHIIVVNKQPDIIVHPARNENKGTMLGALAWHLKHKSSGGLSAVGKELARPGVVHRLDRDTSGCIVFAKSDEAHWKLGHQFEHRRVDKRYLAVVHGLVEPDGFVIDLPLGPHPSREKGYREKYVVRHDELGKESVTIVRVRERYVMGSERANERTRRRCSPFVTPSRRHCITLFSRLVRPRTSQNRQPPTHTHQSPRGRHDRFFARRTGTQNRPYSPDSRPPLAQPLAHRGRRHVRRQGSWHLARKPCREISQDHQERDERSKIQKHPRRVFAARTHSLSQP